MLKSSELLTNGTADSVDKNVIKYIFYKNCKVYEVCRACEEDQEEKRKENIIYKENKEE